MSIIACKWPDCESGVRSKNAEYCGKHYQRARKLSNFDNPWEEYLPYNAALVKPECRWVGCSRKSMYAGYCSRDYSRAKAIHNFENPWEMWEIDGQCKTCGKTWKRSANSLKEYCSNVCSAKGWKMENPDRARVTSRDSMLRRRALQSTTQVDVFSSFDVRAAKGDDCYLCGGLIEYRLKFPDPLSPSMDHIIPLSKGGAHTVENTAMTHLRCNLQKGVSMPKVVA